MAIDDPADAIRRRMAELRRELTYDVRDVGRSARAMANPAYFVRNFPWVTTAIAGAVGYMLVPKKKQVIHPDPEMLAELVRKNQIRIDSSAATKDRQGMLQSLGIMGVTWAAKTGMKYLIEQLTTAAANKPSQPPEASPSPVEQPWNTKR